MAAPPRQKAYSAPRARRWGRRRTLALLGLLAIAIGVRAALPWVARWQIESQATQALGRKVEVADVDFGLLTGRASIEGLAIGGPDLVAPVDPQSTVIRLARLGAQISWWPLVSGKIRVKEIALVEPMLRLDRTPEGGIAPIVLAESPPEPEPRPSAEEEGGGLDLAIEKLSLDAAELRFVRQTNADPIAELRFENLSLGDLSFREDIIGVGAVALRGPDLEVHSDRLSEPAGETDASVPDVATAPPSEPPPPAPKSPPSKHRVEDLDIQNARFAWRLPGGDAVQAELDIHASKIGLGAELFPLEIRLTTDQSVWQLKGQIAADPVAFDGRFEWQGVRLPRLVLLVEDAPVTLSSGTTDGSLQIAVRLAEDDPATPPSANIQGDFSVSDLDLVSTDGAAKLTWKKLAVAIAPLHVPLGESAGAPALHLTKLTLDAPQVEYLLAASPAAADAGTAPASEAETPPPAAEAEPAEPAGAEPQIGIDALELNAGKLRFRDTRVKPPVDIALKDLRIRAQGIQWPERDIEKLVLSAKGQRAATLKLEGGVLRGSGGFDLELARLPLSPFDPYAGGAAGLQIERGSLSLQSKLTLDSKRVGAKSQLALHELSLTERESGAFQQAFGMPLDVAIALLQDLKGDITLPVNVEQDEGGTRIGIAAAVTAALRQALVGALAAPLKLLGGIAGAGGGATKDGLQPIPMEPGAGELSPEGHERVAALAKLLGSRPQLGVLLVGRADASDDPLLARREVLAKARAGEPLAGEDELGFFERRRVRSALAEAEPEAVQSLEPETAAALERMAGQVTITDEAREALALARAQAVAQALAEEHGTSAEAVAEIETETGAPSVVVLLRAQEQGSGAEPQDSGAQQP